MLHAVDTKGWDAKTAWCVPSAISFLTGIPLIHTHSRAAFIQGIAIDDVKGVYGSEAVMLLKEQGYNSRPIDLMEEYSDAPKLKKFLSDRTSYQKCMPMMIQIEGNKTTFCHMIASHFGFVADNGTMKPVPVDSYKHKNKYVTHAWIIEKG